MPSGRQRATKRSRWEEMQNRPVSGREGLFLDLGMHRRTIQGREGTDGLGDGRFDHVNVKGHVHWPWSDGRPPRRFAGESQHRTGRPVPVWSLW